MFVVREIKTGDKLKTGDLMKQWGGLWLIDQLEPSTDDDVWLSLIWVAGRREGAETPGGGWRTTVFYGNDNPVTVVTLSGI